MEVAGKRLDDDTVPELCEPCQEGNSTTHADGFCIDCEENMCTTCFQSHLKLKLCRNHVLGAIDGGRRQVAQKQEDRCKKHTTEIIKYYCRNHDSVGCGDCIVSYHGKCEPEFIRDLAKNFEESPDFKSIVKEVENLEDLKAEIEISLEKYRKDNTEFHDKAIHEIQQNRAEINTWIENVTSKVEAEEMEIWKENEIVLSKLEGWVKIISDMIDTAREETSNEKYKGENLFIHVIECKSKINDFATKSVPEIKSNFGIKSFTFEPNKQLFFLKKSTNLGLIRVGNISEELQTSQKEQQDNMTLNDGATNVASSNLPGTEAEDVGAGANGSVNRSEDPVRAELEKELERIRETTILEKEQRENLEKGGRGHSGSERTFQNRDHPIGRGRHNRQEVTTYVETHTRGRGCQATRDHERRYETRQDPEPPRSRILESDVPESSVRTESKYAIDPRFQYNPRTKKSSRPNYGERESDKPKTVHQGQEFDYEGFERLLSKQKHYK